MSGPYIYMIAHEEEAGIIREILDRLEQLGMILYDANEVEGGATNIALAFLAADDERALSSSSERPHMLHVVVDEAPPQYHASARNVLILKPNQVKADSTQFRMGLEAIVRHLQGQAAADAMALPMDEETQRLYDSIRKPKDDERLRIEAEQQAEAKRNRMYKTLKDPLWGDFLRLVEDEGWRMETGQSYASARHAAQLAEQAAEVAREELGNSYNHTVRGEDVHYRRWGRIHYPHRLNPMEYHAIYEGETDGVDPHGYGIMKFSDKHYYSGQFVRGMRTGYGVGHQGHLAWFGMWMEDEPFQSGVFGTQSLSGGWTYVQGDYLQENMSGIPGWVLRRTGPMARGLLRRLGGDV